MKAEIVHLKLEVWVVKLNEMDLDICVIQTEASDYCCCTSDSIN